MHKTFLLKSLRPHKHKRSNIKIFTTHISLALLFLAEFILKWLVSYWFLSNPPVLTFGDPQGQWCIGPQRLALKLSFPQVMLLGFAISFYSPLEKHNSIVLRITRKENNSFIFYCFNILYYYDQCLQYLCCALQALQGWGKRVTGGWALQGTVQ